MQMQRFVDDLKKEIIYEKEYRYKIPYSISTNYQRLLELIEKDIQKNNGLSPNYFEYFEELFEFHFEYSIFVYTELSDCTKALMHINKSLNYGNILLTQAPRSCACVNGNNPFVLSNKAVFIMSLNLLTLNEHAFDKIGNILINSLNGEGCIIKRGYSKATTSWFVLQLYSLYTNTEIKLHKLLQPKLNDKYKNCLEHWNTNDMHKILLIIDTLCELHLSQASLDLYSADRDNDIHDIQYRELFLPAIYTFPYEILVWLKLREKAGLKKPKTFTHPLMNTPIAKMFLNIKEPLPKPTELPYAKELLEKLKEQCPNVEIPEWLDGQTETKESTTEIPKGDNIIPDDFFLKG